LKTLVEAGLQRIAKVIGDAGSVHVFLTTEKYRHRAEITIKTGHRNLVAQCESTEMEVALRDALAKIEQQAIRHKKRDGTMKRHPKVGIKAVGSRQEEAALEPEPGKKAVVKIAAKNSVGRKAVPMLVHSFPSQSPLMEPHVVRSTDAVALRPMTLEEAVKEAEFRDREVFVFRDMKGKAMVLHRTRDGKMELIEVP
jgi:putative sigma-54 modulation protein